MSSVQYQHHCSCQQVVQYPVNFLAKLHDSFPEMRRYPDSEVASSLSLLDVNLLGLRQACVDHYTQPIIKILSEPNVTRRPSSLFPSLPPSTISPTVKQPLSRLCVLEIPDVVASSYLRRCLVAEHSQSADGHLGEGTERKTSQRTGRPTREEWAPRHRGGDSHHEGAMAEISRGRVLQGQSMGRSQNPQPVRGASPPRGARLGIPRGRAAGSSTGRGLTDTPPLVQHPAAVAPLPAYRQPAEEVEAVGVRRRAFGQAGEMRLVRVNCFPATIEGKHLYQYDDIIKPKESLAHTRDSSALNMQLIRELQRTVAIFNPPAVYDGERKLFSVVELPLQNESEFTVVLPGTRADRAYKIYLERVGESIDTRVLQRFVLGTQSHTTTVTESLQALSVVLRMTPLANLPSSKRRKLFFTPSETREIGSGVVLWRGYFQSLRPALDRQFVNIDIAGGAMYRPGRLIDLACDVLSTKGPRLRPSNIKKHLHNSPGRESFSRFITGVRVEWTLPGDPRRQKVRSVKGLSRRAADQEYFALRSGEQKTVAEYFVSVSNRRLQYPDLVGHPEQGKSVLLPLEICNVCPGQSIHAALSEELLGEYMKFNAQPPAERFRIVEKGLEVLKYAESDYVRQFGVTVETPLLSTPARVLKPPNLRYRAAPGSIEVPIAKPQNGKWNMAQKHFYQPVTIENWALMVTCFVEGCRNAGIVVVEPKPTVVEYFDVQKSVLEQFDAVIRLCVKRARKSPSLFFVILAGNDRETYQTVKLWGDVKSGIPTQCFNPTNCENDSFHFWSNVAHSVNVKLGGVNSILDPVGLPVWNGQRLLGDVQSGTMIMGADVSHPSTGGNAQPSYAALVGSRDSHASRYIARLCVQPVQSGASGGPEIIAELRDMAAYLLTRYMWYRREEENVRYHEAPQRIIFYRDGVSNDQFQAVLNEELPQIKNACQLLNIKPKITLVVVGKRHHIRFSDEKTAGNCTSGTVVDRDIVHPFEFDFYLQSHGPSGLNKLTKVLYDENDLTQAHLSFTCARFNLTIDPMFCKLSPSLSVTRTPAVLVPPASQRQYADRACNRAATHFDRKKPAGDAEEIGNTDTFPPFQEPHINQRHNMYFVSTGKTPKRQILQMAWKIPLSVDVVIKVWILHASARVHDNVHLIVE
ncbi:argonaute-like protein [Mycena crocata]|nr:argonaute-like protein [Mycena crocata]